MAPTPVMDDLEALDAESRSDLGCAHEFIDIDATPHARILPQAAYELTHPPTAY